jgi:hypothetical protein
MIILFAFVLLAAIDHWVGGAGLFRGKKSREAAELFALTGGLLGTRNFFWDTRALPFSAFFALNVYLSSYFLGIEWYAFALPVALTAGYVIFRQRSHRPVFKALNGNTDIDTGNELTTAAVNTFTRYTVISVPAFAEYERFRFGWVWGAWFGFLGMIPGALLAAGFIGWPAVAFPLLGALFGPIHKLFGARGKLNAGGFGRSCSELATGAFIIAPFSIGTILLADAGFLLWG